MTEVSICKNYAKIDEMHDSIILTLRAIRGFGYGFNFTMHKTGLVTIHIMDKKEKSLLFEVYSSSELGKASRDVIKFFNKISSDTP